ncbi:MAG: HAMP domain-containing histidine kinase [Elusimicrobia bacterium]|nr:HAMP domain-containing histidine kinase [Elusimicrobiota bacterium]
MTLRAKLALTLALVAVGSAAAATALLFRSQAEALRDSEAQALKLIEDGIRRVAGEAALAQDPLMLLDHLAHLRSARPEVAAARIKVGGTWREVGGAPASDPGRPISIIASDAEAEVSFSESLLSQRMAAARAELGRRAGRVGAVVALLGVLSAFVLSGPLTRRIVRIERVVAEIGEGRLGVEAETSGSDEVARLARGVNAMSTRLKELDEMKRTFVASVTHELRSPLGAIQAQAAEILAQGGLAPAQSDMLARVQRNAARLEHFVASLLEMARIERGQLEFSPRPAPLGPLVEDVVLFFTPKAREAGLSIAARIEGALPDIPLDPDLVTQAATNLVSNALKYTPKGGKVSVSARRNGDSLELAVTDTGVGIPEDACARIFAPFERVKNPLGAPGVGLGLAVTKAIIDKHRGAISVRSRPGEGSTFTITLPLT